MKKTYGALAAVLLALSSGALILTQEDLDKMYVCPLTTEVQRFDGGLSSTGLTGYPDVRGTEGQVCRKDGISAKWEKFCSVAHRQGYDCADFDARNLEPLVCKASRCYANGGGCVCWPEQ